MTFIINTIKYTMTIQTHQKPEVNLDTLKVNNKITIVKTKLDYAEKIYNELNKSRDDLKEWLSFARDATLESTKEYIKNCLNENKQSFVVLYKNEIVGMMGFANFSREEDWCEIGYWLSSDYAGKGIITKCSRALIDYIFNELDFSTAIIKCDKKNKKSAAVAERLRYDEKIEILKEEYQGKIRDTLIHRFYRDNWKNKK